MVRSFPGIGGGSSSSDTSDSDSGSDDDLDEYESPNAGGTGSFGDRGGDTDETESDPTDQPARGRDTQTGGQTDSPTYDSDPSDDDTTDTDDSDPTDQPARGRESQTGGQTDSPTYDSDPSDDGTDEVVDDPMAGSPTGATGGRTTNGGDDSSDGSSDSGTTDRITRTFPGASEPAIDEPADPRTPTQEQEDAVRVFDEPERLQEEFDIQAESERAFREELRQEAAERYSQATVEDLAFGMGDISLQETDEGYQPQLTGEAQSEIEQFWQGEAAESVREQGGLQDPSDVLSPQERRRFDLVDASADDFAESRTITPENITESGLTPEGERIVAAAQLDEQLPGFDIASEDVTDTEPNRLNPTAPRGEEEFTLDLGTQQDLATTRLREQLTGREDITESDIAGVEATPSGGARAEFTDQFRREQAAEAINQDRTFLPMHDDVEFTASDVTLMGDEATLSESGQAKVEDALAIDALNELEYETGADLTREDVNVAETGEGELQVTLSESGEEAIEIERMPGTDLPYIGGAFEEGVRLRRGFRETTEPVRKVADETIPGEQDFYKGAGVLAPIAVAEPTPIGEVSAGTLAGIGIGIGATASLSNTVVGEDPSASETATTSGVFAGEEIQVPEDGDVVRGSELGTPSGGEVTVEESEIQPAETPLTGTGEIPAVGGEYLESSELSVPSAERTTDPRVLQTQLTQGLLREEEEEEEEATTPTIPAEDIYAPEPEPVDQPGPSTRERQRREDLTPFERTFPTGAGAVVGEGTERIEEAQQQEVTQGEQLEPSEGVETVFGGSGFPVTGSLDRLEEAQEPTLGWDDAVAPLTRPAVREDVRTEPLSMPQEAVETQQNVGTLQQADLLNEVAQTQETTAEATETAEGYEYPQETEYPYEYGYGYGYGDTPRRSVSLPSPPLPDFEEDEVDEIDLPDFPFDEEDYGTGIATVEELVEDEFDSVLD